MPATVVILLLLFFMQKRGTAGLGGVFGPIMLVWFGTIALLGAAEIARAPGVLWRLNPWHAVRFVVAHGWHAFLVLGAVVLAVTGAEALYADMGHFGRRPIRLAWFVVVLPALLLNYFGQGALLLRMPEAVANPFYHLAPRALLLSARGPRHRSPPSSPRRPSSPGPSRSPSSPSSSATCRG